jgi:hypothetical protein
MDARRSLAEIERPLKSQCAPMTCPAYLLLRE